MLKCREISKRSTCEIYRKHGDSQRSISTQENFPRTENFVKCDWPTQIFRRKKILKLKIFNF
jgi:hypothetical protein